MSVCMKAVTSNENARSQSKSHVTYVFVLRCVWSKDCLNASISTLAYFFFGGLIWRLEGQFEEGEQRVILTAWGGFFLACRWKFLYSSSLRRSSRFWSKMRWRIISRSLCCLCVDILCVVLRPLCEEPCFHFGIFWGDFDCFLMVRFFGAAWARAAWKRLPIQRYIHIFRTYPVRPKTCEVRLILKESKRS